MTQALPMHSVVAGMAQQGSVYPTGFPPLDRQLRGGGLRSKRILVIAGPPEAGKTTLAVQIAYCMASQLFLGTAALFADEGREQAVVRMGQQMGFDRDLLEAGDVDTVARLAQRMGSVELLFDNPQAQDSGAERLVKVVDMLDKRQPRVLVIDSAQRVLVRPHAGSWRPDKRTEVSDLMGYLRKVSNEKDLIVILTSQVSRDFYKARNETERSSALASGAESRAIEFESDVMVVLERPGGNGIGRGTLEKNRLKSGPVSGPFYVRMNYPRARLEEVSDED